MNTHVDSTLDCIDAREPFAGRTENGVYTLNCLEFKMRTGEDCKDRSHSSFGGQRGRTGTASAKTEAGDAGRGQMAEWRVRIRIVLILALGQGAGMLRGLRLTQVGSGAV